MTIRSLLRLRCQQVLIVVCMCSAVAVKAAEPPKIERVFPAGGQQGTDVEIELQGKLGETPLQLHTSTTDLVAEFSEDATKATVTIGEQATPGVHWLRFYNGSGATDLIPFVVGMCPELNEAEPNDRIDQATVIPSSRAVANGVLAKSGEVDVFSVELQQGTVFVAHMEANAVLGSPMDAVLQLLDEKGTVLDQNDDDFGFDPRIVWPVTHTGKYYIRTFAFPSAPNSTIRFAGANSYIYRILATTEAFVDHVTPSAVMADQPTELKLTGWNLPQASISVAPPIATNLQRLTGASTRSGNQLELVDQAGTCELDEGPPSEACELPVTACGTIAAANERDIWSIKGVKGQQVQIKVAARSLGSLLDPVLRVLKPDGGLLKEYDDADRSNLDTDAAVKLPEDGEYKLEIRDRYAHAGARYFYRLTCRTVQPDFALSVEASQFVVPEAGELEIPVTITRSNGFENLISVSAVGLPESVVCSAVESKNGEDSGKKVTLKITRSGDSGYSGPITIVGTETPAGDEAAKQHAATASISNVSTTTEDLWLTVLAAKADADAKDESDSGDSEGE